MRKKKAGRKTDCFSSRLFFMGSMKNFKKPNEIILYEETKKHKEKIALIL